MIDKKCCSAIELTRKSSSFVRECNESETGEAVLWSWL